MTDAHELKALVKETVQAHRGELEEISLALHSNPEVSLEESDSARLLGDYLTTRGFSVTNAAYHMPTAFEGTFGNGSPHIGIIAEYDALPGIGHACGHNVIATAALGAGLAAKTIAERLGGTIHVIGTPGEEGKGGKVLMANSGAFANLDVAMMIHPGSQNMAGCLAMAVAVLDAEFMGKAAHAAAAPEQGVNALEAMIITFNAINALRQHVRDGSRIHGIITEGGQAPNVVPDRSAGTFYVRARDDVYLEELKERVIGCFRAGAYATGCEVNYQWNPAQYRTMNNNAPMAYMFAENLRGLDRTLEPYEDKTFGSTDMGNVSFMVPSIHPIIAVSPPGIDIHTVAFAEFAKSEAAHSAMIDGAIAMAWTIVDLMSDPSNMAEVKKAFQKGM